MRGGRSQITTDRSSSLAAWPARPPEGRPALSSGRGGELATDLGPILVLVLWIMCLGVGVAGLLLPYPRPRPPVQPPTPIRTRLLDVQLTDAPPPTPKDADAAGGPAAPSNTAAPPQQADVPQSPPLPAVAKPGAAVAFALPVEGLTRLVDVKQADFARPAQPMRTLIVPNPNAEGPAGPAGVPGGRGSGTGTGTGTGPAAATTAPAVQTLTYGQGEGAQPAPDYPRDAVTARQQGAVGIRFSVGTDGRVTAAKVYAACSWPLLNQAALRAVRDTWLFLPGPRREYEVLIDFELTQK